MSSDGHAPRSRRTTAAVFTAVIAASAIGQLLLAAPALAAPALSVTPSSGLGSGQSVTVHGTGFSRNATDVNVVQCPASNPSADACNIGGGRFFQRADGSGSFTVTLTVLASFGPTDCTRVTCMIVAHEGTDPNSGATAQQSISFGAAVTPSETPAQAPTTSATTATVRPLPSAGVGGVSTSAAPRTTSAAAGAVPTGANTGRPIVGSRPWASAWLAGAGVALLAVGVLAQRRRASGRDGS